jgi:hypothetical protein
VKQIFALVSILLFIYFSFDLAEGYCLYQQTDSDTDNYHSSVMSTTI